MRSELRAHARAGGAHAVFAVGCAAGVVLFVRSLPGCYAPVPDDGLVTVQPLTMGDGGADSASVPVGPGGPCSASANPGDTPPPNCRLYGGSLECPALGTATCTTGSAAACGESLCQPTASNRPPVYDFRVEALHIIQPAALTSSLVQDAVINDSLAPNSMQCGNPAPSDCGATCAAGAFNWLLTVNRTAGASTGTLKTGGGLPVTDPYKDPYCYLESAFSGIDVRPTTPVKATFKGSTFTTDPIPVVNMPAFTSRTDTQTPIILPIRDAVFSKVTISQDGNCIGDINPAWYGATGPSCQEQDKSCPKWFTDGAITGYMTLADANKVVLITSQTLCALLVGEVAEACTAADLHKGDYCGVTRAPGACPGQPGGDSVWLSATFAANAVKISEATCK